MLSKNWFVLCLLLLSVMGNAQTFSISLANPTQTSTSTFEVDVMISVLTPTNGVRLASVSCGINYNSGILNGGTPCTTNNCGSWSLVPGTVASELSNLLTPSLSLRSTAPVRVAVTMINQGGTVASDVPVGTYRVGRFRFTNTVPFAQASNASLWLQNVIQGGNQNAIVGWFAAGTSTPIANATTITSGSTGQIVSLSHTSAAPLTLMLNAQVCATSASQTASSGVTCFGGNNGSSTITMSPTPTVSAITYTVDGGASQSATLVGGAFTVTGLTAGAHTIVISNTGCGNVTASGVSVATPANLVASSSAGTISCYGGSTTVTVSATGGTAPYTGTGSFTVSAGAYSYTVTDANGCTSTVSGSVSQPTQLNASASAGSISCFGGSTSVTVSATGGTAPYTGTGSFTVSAGAYSYTVTDAKGCTSIVSGSVSQPTQLNASASAGSISCFGGSTTVTVSATGGTAPYTGTGSFTVSSGAYSYTVTDAKGCASIVSGSVSQPAQLTNSTTASACDSYTWSVNGATYTTSGTYTATTTNGNGCSVNQTLNLTINHSSTSEETQVACDSYVWHGVTYTTSGDKTYTSVNASGCSNVATLHLTINNSSTSEETQVACDSYTWHGVTYTTSGDKTYTSTNASGCPNVATLHLTINNNSITDESATACESYTWHGTTYTTSGDYAYSSTNGSGCENVARLHLTINSNAITTQAVNPTICKLSGATATISVVASASSSPVYKWYSQAATASTGWTLLSDNLNYSSTGSSTLVITRSAIAVPAAGTKYKVEVLGGSCATATSSVVVLQDQIVVSKAALVTVVSKLTPLLTTCEGTSVNLQLAAGSIGNVQWQSSVDNSTWINVGSLISQTALSATNGIIPFNTGVLAQTTWFRVISTNGVCTSATSAAVKITVSTTPTSGIISGGDVTVCAPLASGLDLSGATTSFGNSTILNLNGATFGATILWQKCANYTAVTPTWASVTNTTTATNTYSGAGTTALTVGNLSASSWYRAQITNGACVVYTDVVSIIVSPAAKAGTITSPLTVCAGGNISFTSAAYTGTSIGWEVSTTSPTTGFTAVSGENGLVFNMTNVPYAPLSKFYVRSVVTSGSCTIARSAVKTITVNPLSVAGTVTGGGTVCSSGVAGTLKLTGNTGTIQWQYSTDGTNYSNVPVGATTAATFGTNSTSATAATYIVTNVTSDTYFRALVTSGACSSSASNAVQFVVGTAAVSGTAVATDTTVCSGTGTTISLSGNVGSIVWQKSINYTATTPTWTAITTSVSSTLATGNLTVSTAYRAVVSIGSCAISQNSNVVIVSVPSAPVSKGITANVTTPAGTALAPICTSSTAKVLSVTAGYVGSIQWQSSTTSATAGFSDISGATGTSYTITNAAVGANYYRVKFTNSCGVIVNSIVLTVYYMDCGVVKTAMPVVSNSPFGVVAYPNPSSESFNFNLTTSSEEKVGVMVYDMTGKLIDQREVTPSEVSALQVGDRYPSGVYNVIVTQGENAKTLRVIKR